MPSELIAAYLKGEGVCIKPHIWARRDYINEKWGSTMAHYTHDDDRGWSLVFDGPGPLPPKVVALIKAHATLVDAGL